MIIMIYSLGMIEIVTYNHNHYNWTGGKLSQNYGKSLGSMGESTIHGQFQSYVKLPEDNLSSGQEGAKEPWVFIFPIK